MDKAKAKNIRNWTLFFVGIGLFAGFVLPEHAIDDFFGLLGEILRSLFIGAF